MSIQTNLSRYRDELKGFAILWIVLFHAKLEPLGALYQFARLGYGGVDIFMLLMGFGLCRSLDKSPELGGYLRRRAARVLPSYWPFCAVWLCVMLPTFDLSLMQKARVAIGNITMVGMFAGAPRMISWYVSLLLVAILLAPFVHVTLGGAKRPFACLMGWLAVTTLASVCCWGTELTMAASRLPIFVLGMGLAAPEERWPAWARKPEMRAGAMAVGFVAGLAALALFYTRYPVYLNDCGMYWYPMFAVAPALCAGLAWLMRKCDGHARLFTPLRCLGRASFEVFLFNCWAEVVAAPLGMGDTVGGRLLMGLASVLVGVAYHFGVARITKRVTEQKKQAKSA